MILHSQIIGEGTPLIILHGFMGMGDNWKTLGNRFAEEGYQVHLVDQRNHGRSFHSDVFTYESMAYDLLKYIDHYNLESISLLGHSMGGKTAMQFACEYPHRVHKLLVADIGPKAYPQHHQDILKALSLLDFNTLKTRKEADGVLSNYIRDLGTRQFLLKNLYWVEKGVLGLRVNLEVVTKEIAEVGKSLNQSFVFEKETLFLRGSKSGYIEDVDELLILKQFPKSKIVTVANAGHWLHAENPDEFYLFVMNFL
ncbi:alpha/beta hydrolase [Patiriisocius marinus]|uniref:Alpha/beta hydrolase n=1 Tax=Patiriisocius marinus TaxID=1397112 RepID=A0A5J4J8Z4_9FLAO|nr:alpha/beta fold hydrolase [Patiriisocius marinus]GER60987.1 alpha/beta hydrolase [Patiriisocius marinus]